MATGPVDLEMGAGYRSNRPPITNSPMPPRRHPLTLDRLYRGMALCMSREQHEQLRSINQVHLSGRLCGPFK